MSAKLPLYKKVSTKVSNKREIIETTDFENSQVDSTIRTFIQLFKDKHL